MMLVKSVLLLPSDHGGLLPYRWNFKQKAVLMVIIPSASHFFPSYAVHTEQSWSPEIGKGKCARKKEGRSGGGYKDGTGKRRGSTDHESEEEKVRKKE